MDTVYLEEYNHVVVLVERLRLVLNCITTFPQDTFYRHTNTEGYIESESTEWEITIVFSVQFVGHLWKDSQ